MSACSDQSYQENEIIWAKVLGYPWWPAQIISIMTMSEKNGQYLKYKVNFIADTSHAILRSDKIKKWDEVSQFTTSRKLKESIDLANQLISGNEIVNENKNLNEHQLKCFVMKIENTIQKTNDSNSILETLNDMTNNELLTLVKMNLGQQYFELHQSLKNNRNEFLIDKVKKFVNNITQIIGYSDYSVKLIKEKPTPNSDDTNQIIETITKKVKLDQLSQDTLLK